MSSGHREFVVSAHIYAHPPCNESLSEPVQRSLLMSDYNSGTASDYYEEDRPLDSRDLPDVLQLAHRQLLHLRRHLEDYIVLDTGDKAEFIKAKFRETWDIEHPGWSWEAKPPKKKANPKYHWTKAVRSGSGPPPGADVLV